MEKLIAAINKLQDAFNTLPISTQDFIQLPQIVMVGAQSTGKSSTLESIVRHSFLPRGKGIVTRCPLVLQLIQHREKIQNESNFYDCEDKEPVVEYGVFQHKPDEKFYDFDEIRQEIENYTDEIAGDNKGITKTPISLKIYSPNVVNLTLVDLPGLIKVPVGDQPEDIEDQTLSLIMEYVKNPNSIILAVSSAEVDLATSESLKIAKEVDPEGKRTLAVLTKLDRMENFSDGLDILTGQFKLNIPVKLGVIGIFNRNQNEKTSKERTIEEQLQVEKDFLDEHFPQISKRHGIPYLEKSLSNLLVRHIQECLPKLKNRIDQNLAKNEKIIEDCGYEITNKSQALADYVSHFYKDFCDIIEGKIFNLFDDGEKLIGGPAIRKVFDEKFTKEMLSIDPQISKNDIIKYIKQVGGPRSGIFAPESLFVSIVMNQIERLRAPSVKCAKNVEIEMQKIIKFCVKIQHCTQRFPALVRKLNDIMMKLLDAKMLDTCELIGTIIRMELSSINTNHPDFNIQEVLKEYEIKQQVDMCLDMNGHPEATKIKNIKESDDVFKTRKSEQDAIMIEKLIREYFALEKKKVEDSVPKSIMLNLINSMKEDVLSELLSKLCKDEENLLSESEDVTEKRNAATIMLQQLRVADEAIEEVYEIAA